MQRLPKVTPIIPIPLYCPMYRQYSSTRVLTLQYLPGVKITDTERLVGASVDLDLVARCGYGREGPGVDLDLVARYRCKFQSNVWTFIDFEAEYADMR